MKRQGVVILGLLLVLTSVLSACATPPATSAPPTSAPPTSAPPTSAPATAVPATAAPQAAGPITVGLSWNRKDQAIIVAWEDYMKQFSQEYAKEVGRDFVWVVNVADGDPSRQAANIEDLINQGVDVIIARAEDGAAIGASIKAAHEAGIPFVTFDRESSTDKPDAHVGGDSYNQAVSTGEAFAELLKAKGIQGKCIELLGDLRDVNAVKRSEGWHAVEDQVGAWETVVQVPTEWNPEKFLTGTANALQAYPDANCMFVASNFTFTSVQAALENAGRWAPTGQDGHMWVAAQDINPQGLAALEAGYIDVVTSYDAYYHSVEAVKVITRLAQGEDLGGQSFLVAGRVGTPENIKEMEYVWSRDYQE